MEHFLLLPFTLDYRSLVSKKTIAMHGPLLKTVGSCPLCSSIVEPVIAFFVGT